MTLSDSRITLVGGGNMGGALASGLLSAGLPPGRLTVVEPDAERRRVWAGRGALTDAGGAGEPLRADLVILAVKPQVMASVLAALAPRLDPHGPVWLSVAAGLTSHSLAGWLAQGSERPPPVVRAMPNTPALVGVGASALYANPAVTAAGQQLAEAAMGAVGLVVWVSEESQIDAVTALSGSGPAYFFAIFEALVEQATALGLEPTLARRLAVQTAHGAAALARDETVDLAELRRQVTSPGGTTEAALAAFVEAGLAEAIGAGMAAAYGQARELAAAAE